MKTIIQNQTLHIALMGALFLLVLTTDDPVKDALFKSLLLIAAVNLIRMLSHGGNAISESKDDLNKKTL